MARGRAQRGPRRCGGRAGTSREAAERLRAVLREAEVLLVVPPFATLRNPCLGVHLLQACGRQAGFRVQVLYANLFLAARIGEAAYARICDAPMGSFAGERFFARAAFGGRPLGRRARRMFEPDWVIPGEEDAEFEANLVSAPPLTLAELRRLERHATGTVESLACAITARGYPIVGCTSTFEQTAASIALLNRVKALRPETLTLLGGANCEGEMAQGIALLGACPDHIFSGESEATFPRLVTAALAGARPASRIIRGEPCANLDALPLPRYHEFYEQRAAFLPASPAAAETELVYESSRGCWWGEKHHCTFCGLNGETMAFRKKSPDRFVRDLRALLAAHPTRKVLMADNIMPRDYFKSLLPRLATELPHISLFYEQKANLTLENLLTLKRAGVARIQPGIEALSSPLLQRMRKGVQARQNLALLRYARATGIELEWNLLWGFPGDEIESYRETLALLPLLHHLPPPAGLLHLSIDRFSPYFSRAAEFGVRRLRPLPGYADFLPPRADVGRLAYHFQGDYASGAHRHPGVIARLAREVSRWQLSWSPAGKPTEELALSCRGDEYVLEDTRAVAGKGAVHRLNAMEAASLVTPRPFGGRQEEAWALRENLAVRVDGWFVPLAVAAPGLLLELTARFASAAPPRAESLSVFSSTPA